MKNDLIEKTIKNLQHNGFKVNYFTNRKDAKAAILNEILPNESIGFGGSATVEDLKIYESLKERGNPVFWHWRIPEGEDRKEILKKAANTNIYFSGTNAITESGSLVNIDGTGNRLSGMLFGHDKIFIVTGVNKITRNYEEAILRIKNVSCPANTKRLRRNTPCAKLGKCMNCDSPDRICKATLIIDRQPSGVPISIFLINEELGY
ncbi:MAG: lactate utilization protein [Anaerovoracaceae bacterium]|jgi:L-lactate utilization protein LutB